MFVRLRRKDALSLLCPGSQIEGQFISFIPLCRHVRDTQHSLEIQQDRVMVNTIFFKKSFPPVLKHHLSVLQYNGSSDSWVWSAHGRNDWTAAEISGKSTKQHTEIIKHPSSEMFEYTGVWWRVLDEVMWFIDLSPWNLLNW